MEIALGAAGDLATHEVDLLVVGASARRLRTGSAGRPSTGAGGTGHESRSATGRAGAFGASGPLASLDRALGGALSARAEREEFEGKPDQTLELHPLGAIAAHTVLVVGLGRDGSPAARMRAFAGAGTRAALRERAGRVAVLAPDDEPETLRALAEGMALGAYRFTKYLTGSRRPREVPMRGVVLATRESSSARRAVELGARIGNAICLARDLINEPPSTLDAPALAERARAVATRCGLSFHVLDEKGIAKKGMRLLQAVNQGSTTPPRFVHMVWAPRRAKKRLVFVGKGVTFDSGGLSLKSTPNMVAMKIDMAGAATVVGLMEAVAALAPPVEVHGIFAATDNMPDGNAFRLGDVVTSLDGKTVEITNTDAEGRLILADALTYARDLGPDLLVDVATLTGATRQALGGVATGFFTSDDAVANEIAAAAREAGEAMWRMPLYDELRDELRSDIADLKNCGTGPGGAISAALFLREFVGDAPWAHLDIAGPVIADKASGAIAKGPTGHGVLTFLSLVERAARASSKARKR